MSEIRLTNQEIRYFMQIAVDEAALSPDPSTQNGAVLVGFGSSIKKDPYSPNRPSYTVEAHNVAYGHNTFPKGIHYKRPIYNGEGYIDEKFEDRLERPRKYQYIEHAERNSIYDAARKGVSTSGLTMICLWAACTDCARAIIQAGIYELITLPSETNDRWDDSIIVAMGMLDEANVKVSYYTDTVYDNKDYDKKEGASYSRAHELLRNGKPWRP